MFLSLQNEENYPSQSLIEAMACKNAIVATDVGLTHKLIDKNCGILVAKNTIEVGEAILSLFSNNNDLKRKGECSRRKVIKTHTPQNYYEHIIGLIKLNST